MRKAIRRRYPYTDSHWYNPKVESDWHALRRDDVTATEAAALFGVSPWTTPFELHHQKAGLLSVEIAENERMLWGKRLEPVIAAGICQDNGWRIVNASPYLYVRSPVFTGMGASPDRVVWCPTRGLGLLEIKNVDARVARADWEDDEAPVHIEFQLQHQLECSGLSWGAVGSLVGGNDARVIIRERDHDVGAEIGARVTDLWRRVRDADPPPPDYLADFDAIKRLYRNAEVGRELDATAPENAAIAARLVELCAAERRANAVEKAAKDDKKRAQAKIIDLLRDHERVTGLDGFGLSATTVHRDERTKVVKATSYRNLRVTERKPKETKK